MPVKNQHEERSARTSKKVLSAAKRHFVEKGYASVSTDALVQEIGLTRGALYHHFDSKQGLFEAVVESLHKEISIRIREEANNFSDPWEQLIIGCSIWLDNMTDKSNYRILLIDAPSVIGWEKWLTFDSEYGTQTLRESLDELVQKQIIEVPSVEALLHLLNGAMNQAALWVAHSETPQETLKEVKVTLEHILNSLKR